MGLVTGGGGNETKGVMNSRPRRGVRTVRIPAWRVFAELDRVVEELAALIEGETEVSPSGSPFPG